MKWSFRNLVVLLVVLFMLGAPFLGLAQGDPGDPGCDPLDPACPIDGGLSLLIAAGIGLGAKKAYDAKNKNKEEGPSA